MMHGIKSGPYKLLLLSVAAAALTACGGSSSTKTSTTTTVVPNLGALKGAFVFTAQGTESDGAYYVAGELVADGKGNISSGVADYNLPAGIDSDVQLTGTYTLSSNGVGMVSLTDGQGTQDTFQIQTVAGGYHVTSFDSSGFGTFQAVSGTATTANQSYSFSLGGQGFGTIDASGSFTTNASSNIASGTESYMDANISDTQDSLTGFLGVQENGRGYAQIGGNTFSYYAQSPSQLVLVGLDSRVLLYGTAQLK